MGQYLTVLKRRQPWRQQYHAPITRYPLQYLADAYKTAFQGAKGWPKCKSRFRDTPACTIPQDVQLADGGLTVPKIGWMQLKGSNPYAHGEPRLVRVRQEGLPGRPKWYVYIFYKVPADSTKQGAQEGVLGLDRNVQQCVASDGAMYRMTDTARLDVKIKRYQRLRARKRRGSVRHRRIGGQLTQLQRKRTRVGADDMHQISRRIADQAHTVVVEALHTQAMTRAAKGDMDNPGSKVKQKAGLNREILRSHWSNLHQTLSCKCGAVKEVNPAYTSQTCCTCGYIHKDNRKTRASFRGLACGLVMQADGNAALNIVGRAHLPVARGNGATARREALPLGTLTTREQGMPA